MNNPANSSSGFNQKTLPEKHRWLEKHTKLTQQDLNYLSQADTHTSYTITSSLIENVVGTFHLPIGIIPYININQQVYTVPLAVEESSIVAACNKMSKDIDKRGGQITASHTGSSILGQVVINELSSEQYQQLSNCLTANMNSWIDTLHTGLLRQMKQRGGGLHRWHLKSYLTDCQHHTASLFVELNTVDAMGANLVTQTCEWLARSIESQLNQSTLLSIVCNYSESALVEAVCRYPIDRSLGHRISQASQFATLDIHRATTHNKGIMNAIDGLMVATGNDWRAVSASMHAYACRTGQYQPLSQWHYRDNHLEGRLVAPIQVGTVGGVTRIHPDAQLCLKLLNQPSSQDLAIIAGSIGLVQNLAALSALVDGGLIAGHMRLHIDNMLLAHGVAHETQARLRPILIEHIKTHQSIQPSDITHYLNQLDL